MEILNSRELASLIWFGIVSGLLIWKARAWGALKGVFRSFFKPVLLRVIATMVAWVAGSVWLLWRLDLWTLGNLKTTIFWFVAFAMGWMLNVKRWEGDPGESVKATLREVLGVTAFVTFFVEFYTFNLLGELIFVPVISFIVLLGTFAQGRKGHELVAKVLGGMTALIGWGLLAYAAWRLFSDLRGFATPENGREFAVPGLLSLLFLPFMYVLGVQNAYGEVSRALSFNLKDEPAFSYAKRRLPLWFGLDVALMRRWRVALFRLRPTTPEEVRRTVLLMKAARRRERFKPQVPLEFGWSPYRAAFLLSAEGLKAGPYNPDYNGGWLAASSRRELSDGVLGDALRYQVEGGEEIATKLTLTFTRDRLRPADEDTPQSSIDALKDAVVVLLVGVFGQHAQQVSQGLMSEAKRTVLDGVVVEFVEDEGTQLVIRHPLHIEPPE
jgi:hypothetical protein